MIAAGDKIAVTGASGFIGGYLVDALREQGFCPVTVGRDAQSDRQTDYGADSLRAALSGCRAVVHLAGRRMTREDDPMDLAPFLAPNVEAVGQLARAAGAEGLDCVVLASTIAVYSAATPAPFREDGPTHPMNAYALSKLMAESYLEMLTRKSGLRTVCLRLAAVYGHGEKGTPALMRFINQAQAGQTLRLTGNTNYTIDQIYVRDAVGAILAALLSDQARGVCNIGGGRAWTVRDLAQTANEVFENAGNLDRSDAHEAEAVQSVMDLTRAAQLLGWSPAYDLRRGLEDLKAICDT